MTKFANFWKEAFHKSSLLRNVIVMFSGIVICILFALPFGIEEVIEFVTSTIIIMVITQTVGDMWFKVTHEPEMLCWQYWVGIVGVLGSDWLFMWASKSLSFTSMFVRLGLCVTLAIASTIWYELVYGKIVKTKKAESLTALKEFWAAHGVSEEIIEATIEGEKK